MITRKEIREGFEKGIISISSDVFGCLGVCCQIEANAFYFMKDPDITIEEYWREYTLEETIDMIEDILKSEKTAEENGIDECEYNYYETMLKI